MPDAIQKIPSLCLVLLLATAIRAQHPLTIEVSAGKYARYQTPVQVKLPAPLPAGKNWQLHNPATGKSTAAQLLENNVLVFILPDSLPPGTAQTYRLEQAGKKQAAAPVTIEEKEYGLLVSSHRKPVLFYHTKTALPPVDSLSLYQRSGFIHPLYSPNGRVLTDDFPKGHMHQHALFTAWTSTRFRGDFVDFWNQQKGLGTVEHAEVVSRSQGPVLAQLQVKLRHKSTAHGEVLQELWTIRVYPFADRFLFDLLTEQRNTTTDTLYLNEYHYGGIGFRGSREWNPDDPENFKHRWQVLTSEGKKDSAANHTHARWVDASGLVNKAIAGATMLAYPSNFRYPQAIRVHPTMPYWVYSPVVDGAFTIDPGGSYRADYRYYIHEGKADPAIINSLGNDLSSPPAVKVIEQ